MHFAGTACTGARQSMVMSPTTASDSVAHPTQKTQTTSFTASIPGGTRNVRMNVVTNTSGATTFSYSNNGGGLTAFTSGDIISMTNGTTLIFKVGNSGSGAGSVVITANDGITGAIAGTWTLTVT